MRGIHESSQRFGIKWSSQRLREIRKHFYKHDELRCESVSVSEHGAREYVEGTNTKEDDTAVEVLLKGIKEKMNDINSKEKKNTNH